MVCYWYNVTRSNYHIGATLQSLHLSWQLSNRHPRTSHNTPTRTCLFPPHGTFLLLLFASSARNQRGTCAAALLSLCTHTTHVVRRCRPARACAALSVVAEVPRATQRREIYYTHTHTHTHTSQTNCARERERK